MPVCCRRWSDCGRGLVAAAVDHAEGYRDDLDGFRSEARYRGGINRACLDRAVCAAMIWLAGVDRRRGLRNCAVPGVATVERQEAALLVGVAIRHVAEVAADYGIAGCEGTGAALGLHGVPRPMPLGLKLRGPARSHSAVVHVCDRRLPVDSAVCVAGELEVMDLQAAAAARSYTGHRCVCGRNRRVCPCTG